MELLELHNITKHYPGVVALNDVSISFRQGEVHALVGENGAGKSTFIKTISGRGLSRRNLSQCEEEWLPAVDAEQPLFFS